MYCGAPRYKRLMRLWRTGQCALKGNKFEIGHIISSVITRADAAIHITEATRSHKSMDYRIFHRFLPVTCVRHSVAMRSAVSTSVHFIELQVNHQIYEMLSLDRQTIDRKVQEPISDNYPSKEMYSNNLVRNGTQKT
jgi:hypothetical protein